MRQKTKYKIFIAFLIGVLTILMTGCGRTYHIKGRVVFLPQLGSSNGLIAEITGQQIPSSGQPIEGAKVRMFHQFDKEGKPLEGSVWEQNTLTDTNGYFEIRDYAAPYDNVPVGLEISKDGYNTVRTVYVDYLDKQKDKSEMIQVFFVVLSPSASNNSFNPTRN